MGRFSWSFRGFAHAAIRRRGRFAYLSSIHAPIPASPLAALVDYNGGVWKHY